MTVFRHLALVPADGGRSLLTVDGGLPAVESEAWRLPSLLAELAPLVGRPVYLRLAAALDDGDEHLRLHTFDAADGEKRETLPLAAADPDRLVPPDARPALARWLAEQRGELAPPALRPPWSRPGWHARAEAWARSPLEPERIWPLSAVLRGERDGAPVYFKASFRLFRHEAAVTAGLAREHPGVVPDVVALDRRRGWLLMRELPGVPGWDLPARRSAPALRALGAIQRSWVGRADELQALGAPARPLATLGQEVAGRPALERCLDELGALGWPETLGHGDCSLGNVLIDGDEGATIFDWSDACICHPLFDLAHFLRDVGDTADRDLLAAAWAEGWVASAGDVGAALPAAQALTDVHQLVSYRAIGANLAPDDRWWFAGESATRLEQALEAAQRAERGNASQPG